MAKQKHNAFESTGRPAKARVDRWLWAARFFKTRRLAHDAITGGKVERDGAKAKPGGAVKAGDMLTVTKGRQVFEVEVRAVSERRGPASEAEHLYVETEASRARRAREAEARLATRDAAPTPCRRPDRDQRRALRRFKQNR